ncbi:hypothetical protein [Flavobacterium sp. AG291]|uniref:hypothetical protein n=1 Tax=Flavobacterium sp. AG291 TaxID=2184000 RepID=UPI000E2CCC86|nr:hypothetical protein [Flavobacterium sp. AG291]RDI07950.1 hypothetical protein DEU42_11240 [Flavobacterium sp. AG291]
MKRLTNEQIEKIHAALKKTGVLYVDILHEMTDHIASELEDKDGDFDRNLRLYIGRHKKELSRLNRKRIFVSWGESYKGLFKNMFSLKFIAFFGLLLIALTGLTRVMDREGFVTLMLFVFIFANGAISFPQVYRMLKKKDQYSVGEGISILNVFVFFPGLFAIRYMNDIASDMVVVLYFTILLALCAVMAITIRRFKLRYIVRYNG